MSSQSGTTDVDHCCKLEHPFELGRRRAGLFHVLDLPNLLAFSTVVASLACSPLVLLFQLLSGFRLRSS